MITFNANTLLSSFIEHETIKITDLTDGINEIDRAENRSLLFHLDALCKVGFILKLDGVIPPTYTITEAGIKESESFK